MYTAGRVNYVSVTKLSSRLFADMSRYGPHGHIVPLLLTCQDMVVLLDTSVKTREPALHIRMKVFSLRIGKE